MTSVWSTMYSSLSCYRGGVLTVDVVKRVTCFQRQGTSKSFSFSWTPPVLGMFRGFVRSSLCDGNRTGGQAVPTIFLTVSSMYGKKNIPFANNLAPWQLLTETIYTMKGLSWLPLPQNIHNTSSYRKWPRTRKWMLIETRRESGDAEAVSVINFWNSETAVQQLSIYRGNRPATQKYWGAYRQRGSVAWPTVTYRWPRTTLLLPLLRHVRCPFQWYIHITFKICAHF